ncbi:PREDICTED: zinc finger protein 595 [Dufourea novaeangliae]|uniref:Zinc finger protein 27 n=1 Tax=Dufourea novaeangliae TaxID=178035 RepID=A0A154P5L9_DUFNO|nr:PREDICTED: zinc finger protein 595 [Dufourea novaeangliae]KZC06634.1 Zinc finger protein 27 [Dufourea novaeangliae]
MTVVCAAKNCKYSSNAENSAHVIFIHFPNDDTSKIWAHHCGRTDLLMKSNEELHLNYYICSHHIEDRYYINKTDPIIIDQHAVPTLFESNDAGEKDSRNDFDRNEQVEVTDNVLSYCDIDSEIDQYRDISIRFPNLCRICGEPSLDGIEIFAEKGMELKLKEKISLHLPIILDMEDLMPQRLCINCYNKLEIAHLLVITSLKTDMRLKRFLNINEGLNYEKKYNEVAKKCSIEVAEEIYTNECTQTTSTELSPNKVEEIIITQHISTKLSYLENIDIKKTNSSSNVKKEMQSELNRFIQSYNEENKDNPVIETVVNDSTNDINGIACFHCKDSFKTQEIFENHKMLCDEEEMVIQKQRDITNNTNSIESKEEAMNFQFVTNTCNVCHRRFENEKHFAAHRRSNCKLSGEKHYQIPDKLNVTEADCNIHENSDSASIVAVVETNKVCGHCKSSYSTKKELLNHITECHEGQQLFKCIICDKSYEKWSSLDVHEATHRVDKPYLCDLCGKSFKHSNNLRGHKRIHLDDSRKKRHVCEICGNGFRSRFHLGEHMNQHNGHKPYPCEKCGKAFYKRIQLRQHKLSHGMSKHICPICGASFNRKGNMNTHLKRHNNGDLVYTCSVCTYRCKSMSELKLHRKKHTEEDIIESIKKKCTDKTVWQCKICTRIFSTRTLLLNHESIHKGERMSVECDICGKQLASKNSLIYHKKSIHSKERTHMCQYCGESFVSKEARLIHERIHTGERPYVCKICKMEYKCSSNLNQHMKIHSGIKPHRCTYCNKSFTRKGALGVHVRIHTGEKPFSCETCGRKFSQKNDMLKHTKTHHAKTLRCEQCGELFTKKKDILKHIALHERSDPVIQEYVEVQQHMQSYSVNITCSEFE